MAKVSVTFELDNISWDHVRFNLVVQAKTSLGNFVDIAHDTVETDVTVTPAPASNVLSHDPIVIA